MRHALVSLSSLALVTAACGGDRGRSPVCGFAQVAGPALIQDRLRNARALLTDAPRGLPGRLPARVVGQQQQDEVQVGYTEQSASGQLVLSYQGPGFQPRAAPTPGASGSPSTPRTSARSPAPGLLPLVVPPLIAPADAGAVVDATRGLVLTGGEDVDPTRYGAAPHPRLEETDHGRDALELELIRSARARHRPILAICRGIQILNVALGGTLYQDLQSERPGPIDHQDKTGCHAIRVAPDSLLHRTLRTAAATVNSRHHQAVRDLAPGLRATAWAEDGLVEAVEWDAPWMLAVQWHPEDFTEMALFAGFAQAVRCGED